MDKLPLPTFEDDIASWRSFWQRFTSSVKLDIIDEENWRSYIQNALKDATAKEIVQESIEMVIIMTLHLQRRMEWRWLHGSDSHCIFWS